MSWGESYNTFLSIYKEAIKKIRGVVSGTHVVNMGDGQFKAHVEVSVEAFMFSGEVAPTEKGAMAKLFYVVIKYVNVELGYRILDFHSDVWEYQVAYIERFDRNMVNMLKCGAKLMVAYAETRSIFDESVADMSVVEVVPWIIALGFR